MSANNRIILRKKYFNKFWHNFLRPFHRVRRDRGPPWPLLFVKYRPKLHARSSIYRIRLGSQDIFCGVSSTCVPPACLFLSRSVAIPRSQSYQWISRLCAICNRILYLLRLQYCSLHGRIQPTRRDNLAAEPDARGVVASLDSKQQPLMIS